MDQKVYSSLSFPSHQFHWFHNAQIVENQMANLSTSWINNPTSFIKPTQEFGSMITPILLRGSEGAQFLGGFYCPTNQNCYFGVFIFQSKRDWVGALVIDDPKVVWTANGGRPVKYNAMFQLTQNGDMILADADGTMVWSTNTVGKSVSDLNLSEKGNLVIFDRSKTAIWQSFDHPT